jgi:hypothetical protein
MVGADMQIRGLETANSSAIAGLQKLPRAVDSEWAATVERTLGAETGSASSSSESASSNIAGVKLSELMVAHLLREMMPTDSRAESGFAFDTWRGCPTSTPVRLN